MAVEADAPTPGELQILREEVDPQRLICQAVLAAPQK
jgi:hypothetical protein